MNTLPFAFGILVDSDLLELEELLEPRHDVPFRSKAEVVASSFIEFDDEFECENRCSPNNIGMGTKALVGVGSWRAHTAEHRDEQNTPEDP